MAIAIALYGLSANKEVIFIGLLHETTFDGKQTLWTLLDKQNHKNQENNFC
jgi:hypothetical protein